VLLHHTRWVTERHPAGNTCKQHTTHIATCTRTNGYLHNNPPTTNTRSASKGSRVPAAAPSRRVKRHPAAHQGKTCKHTSKHTRQFRLACVTAHMHMGCFRGRPGACCCPQDSLTKKTPAPPLHPPPTSTYRLHKQPSRIDGRLCTLHSTCSPSPTATPDHLICTLPPIPQSTPAHPTPPTPSPHPLPTAHGVHTIASRDNGRLGTPQHLQPLPPPQKTLPSSNTSAHPHAFNLAPDTHLHMASTL
jgi:hypothetical protein